MAYFRDRSLYNILSETNYFEIPIYQRNYTWAKEDCISFLNDIYSNFINNKEMVNNKGFQYYVGNVIIFDLEKYHQVVIDGQQRITTTILILCALRKVIDSGPNHEQFNDWIEKNINEKLKCENNSSIHTNTKLKLNNIENNRELEDIIYGRENNKNNSIYTTNYLALIKEINKIKSENENFGEDIKSALEKTLLVEITIKEHDNPNKMFEVINTTGKKLLPSDLIKNYIFFYSSKYPTKIDEFSNIYGKIENLVGNKENEIMKFYRYIVPILGGKGFKLKTEKSHEIYKDFKKLFNNKEDYKFSKNSLDKEDDVYDVLQEIKKHAILWNGIHNFSTKNKKIGFYYKAFQQTINTYYSLVHQYLFDNMLIKKDEEYKMDPLLMAEILRLICRLIFSLLLIGKAEKNITRGIPDVYHQYKKENNNGELSFVEWFENRLDSDIKLLNRKEIRQRINQTPVFKNSSKKTRILLIGLEMFATNWEKDIDIDIDNLTIEHIMPQKVEKSTDFWKYAQEENENDDEKSEEWIMKNLHTLPNLTIITASLNGKLGNKSFNEKKSMMKNQTAFNMNNKINEYPEWREEQLRDRGDHLTNLIAGLLEI